MQPESVNVSAGETRTAVRILHLEDDEADRELVRDALIGDGLICDFVYAKSRAEFEAALERETFDLVLSDFTISEFEGSTALAFARQRIPDVPFLFVSGMVGEERAIKSLRDGATDYVLKDRPERLLPAVKRALREAAERARRHAADEALRQSEERFRVMAESIDNVFWMADDHGRRLLYVSPAYEQIWGQATDALYTEPNQWTDAVVAEDKAGLLEAREQLARGEEVRVEYRIRRPDGTLRWIDDRSYPIRGPAGELNRAVGVAMDITGRKQLETQLLHAQKMEAVGQLAGGIAHDFNNVLTVVTGYARLLLDTGNVPPDIAEPLRQIYTAGTRATNLTRQLLVFSRRQSIHRRPVDLNPIVDEIAKMLRRLIGEHITLTIATPPQPAAVEADPRMVEQVIMNLALNARDAMPHDGALTIGTEFLSIADPAARNHPDARAGEFVVLYVRDTGCGIPSENLQRIFEPFFTTKEPGRGTGLGLATVFGIVQQHHGWIEVESTVGAGTCFRVFFPAAAAPQQPAPSRHGKAPAVRGGSETVLLIEDEPAVREFAVAVLRTHGYRVLQACSGVEALEVWKWHGPRIRLLFSDMVLPDGLSGAELAERLRRDSPALKVVLTSGYTPETLEHGLKPPAGAVFIHKPYKPRVLAQAIRDALDGTSNH
jgi:hypothetical protein